MTDDLVKRLRICAYECEEQNKPQSWVRDMRKSADHIEKLQDSLARIQKINLRRDLNIETRTKEIDRICRGEPHE